MFWEYSAGLPLSRILVCVWALKAVVIRRQRLPATCSDSWRISTGGCGSVKYAEVRHGAGFLRRRCWTVLACRWKCATMVFVWQTWDREPGPQQPRASVALGRMRWERQQAKADHPPVAEMSLTSGKQLSPASCFQNAEYCHRCLFEKFLACHVLKSLSIKESNYWITPTN